MSTIGISIYPLVSGSKDSRVGMVTSLSLLTEAESDPPPS